MVSDLSVVSFICAALLAVFIVAPRVRGNVANLAIVAWLLGANLVHGINAIVWAGNVDIHVPVWCDIVTKLLLGASVALPGAFFCISRRLELVSSTRPISNDVKSQRNRLLIEFLFCYIIPLIYMAIHFIAQDHRFDLVKDFGCSASIHPSTPALITMWLPPMLVCGLSFITSGLAIHNSFRLTFSRFSTHVEARSPLSSSLFFRRITISLVTTGVLFIVNLFSVFSTSVFRPWTSWSSVHAAIKVISIVDSRDDVKSIQLAWWGVPVVSIIYILLSLAMGEETRDLFKSVRDLLIKISKLRPRSPVEILPTHIPKPEPDVMSLSQSLSTPRTKPHALNLTSGWDEMIETKKPNFWSPGRKSPSSFRTASPSPSSSPTTTEDDAFAASTMDYLGSPVAKTLGLTHPALIAPPAIYVSPIQTAYDDPFACTVPSPAASPRSVHDTPPSPRRVPSDVDSVISSVFDAAWPQPPASPATPTRYRTRSPANSPAASPDLTFGYPLYPAVTPPGKRTRPFQGAGVVCASDLPVTHLARHMKRPSVKNLKRTLSGGGVGHAPVDVIYMTVVKETV